MHTGSPTPITRYLDYQNFDLLITRYGDHYRAFVVDSPAGEASVIFDLPFAPDELTQPGGQVGVRRHLGAADDFGLTSSLTDLGSRLFAAIFRGKVRDVLITSFSSAAQEGCGLRLRLRFEEDAANLANLPWETLYDPGQNHFVGLGEQTPILRYLSLPRSRSALVVKPPLSVLAILSSPAGLRPLDMDQEWRVIRDSLIGLVEDGKFVLERLNTPRLSSLQHHLLREPVHIVHFVGHGVFDESSQTGSLVLEDERGRPELVRGEQLAAILRNHPSTRLVFLNSCEGALASRQSVFTGLAQTLVREGVPAVVAMQAEIGDSAAVELARTFYDALAAGRPVDAALTQARVALSAAGSMEWATPVLFSRSSDNRLFDIREVLPTPDCPYPGMRPFTEAQKQLFFGRDREIEDAVDRLRQHPFLTVVGPSGSGKSSLVYAGVIPALHKSSRFGTGNWTIHIMRPSDSRTPDGTAAPKQALAKCLDCDADDLISQSFDNRTLVVVDQFEEVFAQADASEVQAFLDALQSLEGRPNLYILLTVRADFYDDLMSCSLWQLIKANRLELTPLGEDGLWAAIVEPAARVGVTVHEALAVRLIDDDASESGALPLVQETLVQLWDRAERRELSLNAYRQMAEDGHSGLQVAINRRANLVYENLPDDAKPIARHIFLQLIQLGEGRPDTRRRQTEEELLASDDDPSLFDETLARLTIERLLTTTGDPESGVRQVDLAHEALIKHWMKLKEWLEANRENLRLHQQLAEAAEVWEDLGRDRGALWGGARLARADEWSRRSDVPLTHLQGEFLGASLAERDRETRQEDERRQWELDQARALAEEANLRQEAERQRAEEASRREAAERHRAEEATRRETAERQRAEAETRSRQRITVLASAIAVVAIVAFALYLYGQKQLAKAQRNESLYFAGQAMQRLGQDPVESVQLSATALPSLGGERPYVPEAEFALTQALPVNLEEDYHQAASFLDAADEVAFGRESIAVGGYGLSLVSYGLDPVTPRIKSADFILGVGWQEPGDTTSPLLLSYDKNDVRVWQVDSDGMQQIDSRSIEPECPSGTPCAGWRPKHRDILLLNGKSIALWALSQDPVEPLLDLPDSVQGFDWSDDGSKLAAWDREGNLRVLNTVQNVVTVSMTGTVQARFVDEDRFVLQTRDTPGAVQLWSGDGGKLLDFDTGAMPVERIELSADGAKLVADFGPADVRLYDVSSGHEVSRLQGIDSRISSLAWRAPYLAAGAQDGSIHILNGATGEEVMVLHGHRQGKDRNQTDVLGLQWKDDDRLLSVGMDGSVRLWQVLDEDGKPMCNGTDRSGAAWCRTLGQEFLASPVAVWEGFAVHWLDNNVAVVLDNQGGGWRWSLQDGVAETLWPPLDAEHDVQARMVGEPNGERVLTYEQDGKGQVWNAKTGGKEREVLGDIALAIWPDWREDGPLVAPVVDGEPYINIGYGKTIKLHRPSENADVSAIAVLGNQLAVGWSSGSIQLWDFRAEEPVGELSASESEVFDVQWETQHQRLLSVEKRKIRLWNTSSAKQLWEWPSQDEKVKLGGGITSRMRAVLSPDEQLVAVSFDRNLYILDAKTGKVVGLKLSEDDGGHQNTINNLQWVTGTSWPGQVPSATGQERLLLLTWSGDGAARLWQWDPEAKTLTEVWRVTEPADSAIEAGAVNGDASWILTVGKSKANDRSTLRAWQAWVSQPEELIKLVEPVLERSTERGNADANTH